jgi:hypothetical protein
MPPITVHFEIATAEEAEQLAEALAARADLLRQQRAGTPDVRATLHRAAGRCFEAAQFHHEAASRTHEAKTAGAFSLYMGRLAAAVQM